MRLRKKQKYKATAKVKIILLKRKKESEKMADNKLDIRVYPIDEPKGNTVAFASVAVDDLIAIRGVRVVEGDKGLFVSMPQSQDKKEDFHDIAFPVSGDLRKEINKAVLEEYDQQSALAPDQRGYAKPETGASEINAADIKLDIRVYLLKDEQQNGSNTKAFASITVDDTVAIRGVRVVDGEKGLFVSMPQSRSEKDGKPEYHDVAFPLNGDLRKEISRAVIEKFEAGDKSKDKSLAGGLKNGAEKAAQNAAVPKEAAAKSKSVGVLE
jgi:stage V sporulation protein G